jgi:hypothetical protein
MGLLECAYVSSIDIPATLEAIRLHIVRYWCCIVLTTRQ